MLSNELFMLIFYEHKLKENVNKTVQKVHLSILIIFTNAVILVYTSIGTYTSIYLI